MLAARRQLRSVCLETYLVVGAAALDGVAFVRHGARNRENLEYCQLTTGSGSAALLEDELSLLLTDMGGGDV